MTKPEPATMSAKLKRVIERDPDLRTLRELRERPTGITIIWRSIWIIPAHLLRSLFVAIVFCGWGLEKAKRAWRSRLFADTIAGPLAYEKRTYADNAAAKARVMYGWAKVLRCVIEAE